MDNVDDIDQIDDQIEDEIEDEESAEGVEPEERIFRNITSFTVDWSATTVMERMEKGAIDVSPPYQRKPVWNDQKIWRFLESLMLGIPVPQLVLAAKKDARGKFVVLDGKQRLLAIQHASNLMKNPSIKKFPKLEILTALHGKTLAQILEDSEMNEHWESLLSQPIRTVVVQGYTDERALHSIFHRLNQNSVSLSSHELRRALNWNDFMDWLDHFSADSDEIKRARRIKKADFRMRDAESVLRHLAFSRRFDDYRGDLRKFLDEEAKLGGKNWTALKEEYTRRGEDLNLAISASFDVFGPDAFLRFTPGGFIRRFNAPLFDVMTASLRVPEIREACLSADHELLRSGMKELCVTDPFIQYITSTTKSGTAVTGRFTIWANFIQRLTGVSDVLTKMTSP
ncbi:DUF262 domain-containing protein [Streptomyces sp. B1I3]|uniref:DUF262 domain-containing protein n=1 Tax=Streptomyces sp. B1I3 TaxID=3042264 RepID=UPI00278B804B|nr:DUF262 domain-containing protein [Streptomyces sp. B1I3]MDQ0795125.1 hypothetical protein [Streptomyces sp. B1I3]